MSRPTPWQSFIGNPFLCLPLMLGALYVGYLWMTGQAPWWVALFALIGASGVANAAQRVRAYSAWKREWDNAAAPRTFRPPSGKAVKLLVGLGCWGCLAWMSLEVESSPTMDLAVGAFWLATAIIVIAAIVRAIRGPSISKAGRNVVVGVCLSAARQSSSVQAATAALPAHCQHLMRRG